MKRLALPLLALALIVGGALVAYPWVFGGGPASHVRETRAPGPSASAQAPRPLPRVDAGAPGFSVSHAEGGVEVRAAGQSAWRVAVAGQALSADDEVRTGAAGRAVLRASDGSELTLRPGVELKLAVTQQVAAVALARGWVRAQAGAEGRRWEITASEVRAIGSGQSGERFTVFAGERGVVAVATERGEVRVIARGKEVAVGAGFATQVPEGGVPADPSGIPAELLLSVAWPDLERSGRRARVSGTVAVGSDVSVAGAPVAVGPDGKWRAEIALERGTNVVDVRAEDLSGRQKTVTSPPIVVRPGGPALEVDPSKLWDKKPPPP